MGATARKPVVLRLRGNLQSPLSCSHRVLDHCPCFCRRPPTHNRTTDCAINRFTISQAMLPSQRHMHKLSKQQSQHRPPQHVAAAFSQHRFARTRIARFKARSIWDDSLTLSDLRKKLDAAVADENYALAADVRDTLQYVSIGPECIYAGCCTYGSSTAQHSGKCLPTPAFSMCHMHSRNIQYSQALTQAMLHAGNGRQMLSLL